MARTGPNQSAHLAYLRLITAMYFRDPLREHKTLVSPTTVFVFCALVARRGR